jgi:hypothetical protein
VNSVSSFSQWIYWVFPLGISLTILWHGRRKPTALHMAVFWTVADVYSAFEFQVGFRWCAIIGVTAVTIACLPGLFRLLTAPVLPSARALRPTIR